jgi:hypothetical protein
MSPRSGFAVGLICAATFAAPARGTGPRIAYSTYFGGRGDDSAYGVAVDAGGAAYVTGERGKNAFVLKLDPNGSVAFATSLGGRGEDWGADLAPDAAGNVYVAGGTDSRNFPTRDALQPTYGGGRYDGWVAKLDAHGAVLWSSYLGGDGAESAQAVALGPPGTLHVVGETNSPNFPTKHPLQPKRGGDWDAYLAKLDSSGETLLYSTYLGGKGIDKAAAIAVDAVGADYVVGHTESRNFPTQGGVQPASRGGFEGFVTKLNADGSSLAYSTYLGGGQDDFVEGIALGAGGEAYVSGAATSKNFPTLHPFQARNRTVFGSDAFVSKLDASGAALVYSTYLGGHGGNDDASAITVDARGHVHVAGRTDSRDFPLRAPIKRRNPRGADAFVAEIGDTGDSLAFSTYLGGTGFYDAGYDIALDPAGATYVVGRTPSKDFPIRGAFQKRNRGRGDAFITRFAPALGP